MKGIIVNDPDFRKLLDEIYENSNKNGQNYIEKIWDLIDKGPPFLLLSDMPESSAHDALEGVLGTLKNTELEDGENLYLTMHYTNFIMARGTSVDQMRSLLAVHHVFDS